MNGSADDPAEPLTIVIVVDHAHVSGGLSQVALASARGLRQAGHRVILFAAVPPIDQGARDSGVEVVCLDQPDMLNDPSRLKAAARAIWNVHAQRRLRDLLASLPTRGSVVHLHGWSKALSPSVLRAAEASGIATIQTMHDYVALCPNGAFFNYVKQENCWLRPMSAQCVVSNCDARNYGHKAWRVARHIALAAADRLSPIRDVIYLTERQRQIIEPALPANTRLYHVANPVDVIKRPPVSVAANGRYVFVGRLSAEKGVMMLARAAEAAGVDVEFVGDGPVRDQIPSVLPNASITQWLDSGLVAEHIRAARALVFPSLWHETFGLTVHEALANGVPAIVSDNTVCAGLIEHGVNGLLFRSGDQSDLAAQLKLLQDSEAAGRMGRAAYERYWSAAPTLARHVGALEAVYRQICADKQLCSDAALAAARNVATSIRA